MEKIRIFLVDDHKIFREALKSLLEKNPDYEVVGETGDAFEVTKLVFKSSAHIVCMDIGMPGMNGIETTRRLVEVCPSVKVIALSTHSDQRFVTDMMKAGASAYLMRFQPVDATH